MKKKLYVGHNVIARGEFDGYAFKHDFIGCKVNYNHYISRKVVLVEKSQDVRYYYSIYNDDKKCKLYLVADPNNFENYSYVLNCHRCDKQIRNELDCESNNLTPDFIDVDSGIVDVQPLLSFTKTDDVNLAIQLVKEYNDRISDEDEYIPIDPDSYVDTIRRIDEGIGRRKIKEKESEV